MKKYKAQVNRRWDCNAEIKEIQVERETEASIWINGRRIAKFSDCANYYDKWEDAKSALLNAQQRHVDQLRRRLEASKGKLGNIKGMKLEQGESND